ncbi:MAG: glycosyltransferase [Armatimonadetes bacterium]|nr:glycosyltransferase [Armatimonadota bacterium]MBS1725641.1 glycosyltransferase family 2 protein [Armatimonadota bacterium]
MKLSVVIVNWNTASFLRDCLTSLFQSQVDGGFEVIVVDNRSSDDSVKVVRDEFPEAILLAEDDNHGYAKGNNLGIARATGEYILTLNSDTVLEPDVLERSIQKLAGMPKYGCLSVKLIGADGKPQRSVRGFPSVSGIFGDLSGLGKLFRSFDSYRLTRFDYEMSQDAPQPMGTFLLFRGSVLKDIPGPFDEQFPIFFNEVDLLKQMEARGWKCWYEASISIRHFGGESTKQVKKSMIWESHRSLIRYFSKNLRGLARISLPFLTVAVWLGALVRARGFHEGFRP